MTKEDFKKLIPKIEFDKDLSLLSTFRVGGIASYYLPVSEQTELISVLKVAIEKNIPVLIMAGGSNLVISDKINSLVIHLQEPAKPLEIEGNRVTVWAGTSLAVLIDESIKAGLAGLESLSGIPGTVGGAIVGNAGAYGQSISTFIETITIFDGEKVRVIDKRDASFSYRHSIFKEKPWVVLEAVFVLPSGESDELKVRSIEIIDLRSKKYPSGLRCPGSFFKNVLVSEVSTDSLERVDKSKIIDGKIPAGYLLEAVGACGLKTDNLEIASYHGNLIINIDRANYQEVRALAEKLKKMVFDKFGIQLEEEIRYWE